MAEADLRARLDAEQEAVTLQLSATNGKWFDAEMEKLDRWADDQRKSLKAAVEELEESIRAGKREARQPPTCRRSCKCSSGSANKRRATQRHCWPTKLPVPLLTRGRMRCWMRPEWRSLRPPLPTARMRARRPSGFGACLSTSQAPTIAHRAASSFVTTSRISASGIPAIRAAFTVATSCAGQPIWKAKSSESRS